MSNVHAASSSLLLVQTRRIGDTEQAVGPTPVLFNPFIASLITSYARKKISSCMNDLGPMFLYTGNYSNCDSFLFSFRNFADTDSLIYKMDPKSSVKYPSVDANGVLGELVSELPQNHFIRVSEAFI